MEMVAAEKKIEVTEWVEVTEVCAVGSDAFIVFFEKCLRPAERVLHRLSKGPAKGDTEELVCTKVAKAHRLLFHRINQPHAVREIGPSGGEHVVKLRQLLGRHREIGIKNHEDFSARHLKGFAHGVAFAFPALLHRLDVEVRIPAL